MGLTEGQWGLVIGLIGLVATLFFGLHPMFKTRRSHLKVPNLIRHFLSWWLLKGTNNFMLYREWLGTIKMTEIDGQILRMEENTRTKSLTHDLGGKVNGARPKQLISIGAGATGIFEDTTVKHEGHDFDAY